MIKTSMEPYNQVQLCNGLPAQIKTYLGEQVDDAVITVPAYSMMLNVKLRKMPLRVSSEMHVTCIIGIIKP